MSEMEEGCILLQPFDLEEHFKALTPKEADADLRATEVCRAGAGIFGSNPEIKRLKSSTWSNKDSHWPASNWQIVAKGNSEHLEDLEAWYAKDGRRQMQCHRDGASCRDPMASSSEAVGFCCSCHAVLTVFGKMFGCQVRLFGVSSSGQEAVTGAPLWHFDEACPWHSQLRLH